MQSTKVSISPFSFLGTDNNFKKVTSEYKEKLMRITELINYFVYIIHYLRTN